MTVPRTRCMAVVGTVWTGPRYCGNPARSEDINGRPICGVHKKGNPGIEWHGDRANHPNGFGGHWRFNRGEPR